MVGRKSVTGRTKGTPAPSNRRTTLRDVARVAGVSHNTVSLVVRGSQRVLPETRARVQAVIEHLGYQPHAAASALRSSRSGAIGYLIHRADRTEAQALVDAFRNSVWHGICDTADAGGSFVLHADFADVRRSRALLLSGRVDGLLVDYLISDEILGEILTGINTPAVVIGRSSRVPGVAWVRADEEGGAYSATGHLIDLGHTDIALVTVPEERHPMVREREAGMQRALSEAGLRRQPQRWLGDWTFESGYRIGHEILASNQAPSALFVLNELMAFGLLQAAQAAGRQLPDDISVATVEDSRLVKYVRPALTAVHVPMYRVATRATEVLLGSFDGAASDVQETLATEFVVRASTGKAPPDHQLGENPEPPPRPSVLQVK